MLIRLAGKRRFLRECWKCWNRAETMDKEKTRQILLSNSRQIISDIALDDVLQLIKKAKPEWEQVLGKCFGSVGPAYSGTIALTENVQLSLVVGTYTEYHIFNNGVAGYYPFMWQIVAIEGDEIRANYCDDREEPAPVKNLFETIESEYKRKLLLADASPSPERTNAVLQEYLKKR